MAATIRPSQITFDTAGDSNEILTNGTDRVFIRTPDGVQFTVAYAETGEPTEGNQYLRGVDLADLLDTLSRRGYRVE